MLRTTLSCAIALCALTALAVFTLYPTTQPPKTKPKPKPSHHPKQKQKPNATLAQQLQNQNLRLGDPIFIRIFKLERELEVWIQNTPHRTYSLFKTYPVCTYSGSLGPKLKEGDLQAPEGFYFVNTSRLNPNSRFHLAFNIGYPNAYDRAHNRTGSAIMVHGNCVSIGCFAMTDPFIEEIYTLAEAALNNTQRLFRVHIFPFRMTPENLQKHRNNPNIAFWKNLHTGYRHFETHRIPPNVLVRNKTYAFEHLQTQP